MTVHLYAFSESRDLEGERQRLHQKLSHMAAWNPGWSYGEGETISARSVEVARRCVDEVLALDLEADVFPNLDGGCAVVGYREDKSVEVSIDAGGTSLAVTTERGIGSCFETIGTCDDVTSDQVEESLRQLAETRYRRPEVSQLQWGRLDSSIDEGTETNTQLMEETGSRWKSFESWICDSTMTAGCDFAMSSARILLEEKTPRTEGEDFRLSKQSAYVDAPRELATT